MYEFDKLNGEEIKYISDYALLRKDNEYVNISVILTNKRLILLDYPSGVNNYEEALKTSRGMDYLKKKEPILAVNLEDIKNIESDKYILKDGNYFFLKEDKVKESIIK